MVLTVNDEPFLRDVGFIIESVRATLYRTGNQTPHVKNHGSVHTVKVIDDKDGEAGSLQSE